MQYSCRRHIDYVSVNFLSRVVSAGVSLFVFWIYHPDFRHDPRHEQCCGCSKSFLRHDAGQFPAHWKRLSLLLFLLARPCFPTLYLNEYTPFGLSRRNCRVQFDGSLGQLRPRCPEGRLKNYRTGKSRYDFQQLSSIHQIREDGFVSNGKHD